MTSWCSNVDSENMDSIKVSTYTHDNLFKLRTILDKAISDFVLLLHQTKVKCCTIAHFIIRVIQASGEKNGNTTLDLRILLTDAKLSQSSDSGGANNGVFEDYPVIDISYVFGRLRSLGAFHAKEVEDSDGKLGEFAILNKLAKMCKCYDCQYSVLSKNLYGRAYRLLCYREQI